MVALLAEISLGPSANADRRDTLRRTLRLVAEVSCSEDSARVLILNLSEAGVLIETAAVLMVGESFELELPEAGTVLARVKWARGSEYGCEFDMPVPKSAVSAALLRSPPASESGPGPLLEWGDFPSAHEEYARMPLLMAMLFVTVLFIAALATALPFSANQVGS